MQNNFPREDHKIEWEELSQFTWDEWLSLGLKLLFVGVFMASLVVLFSW